MGTCMDDTLSHLGRRSLLFSQGRFAAVREDQILKILAYGQRAWFAIVMKKPS